MNAPAARAAAAVLLLTLVPACTDEEAAPRLPLRVEARSGGTVDLSGTSWAACTENSPSPGLSERWAEVHGQDGAVTFTVTPYASPGCAGSPGTAQAISAVAYASGQRTVGFTGAPPPELGSTAVVATKVYLDAGALGYGLDCYWLDDTVSPRVLYTGDPDATVDAEGYPNTFLEGGEQEQVPATGSEP